MQICGYCGEPIHRWQRKVLVTGSTSLNGKVCHWSCIRLVR